MPAHSVLSRRTFIGIGAGLATSSAVAGSSPPASHKYEDFLPEEFSEELARAPIAYWGCGAMEEHGLHNNLGVDLDTAYEVCLRAVKISGGVVFPPVPFAPAYQPPRLSRRELRQKAKELYPPSLWVSGELCRQLYVELMESLADLGFKSCIAFGGHAPADSLLQQIEKELGGRIGAMRFWGGGTISILADHMKEQAKENPLGTGHGTMWETSIAMALPGGRVELERAKRIKGHPTPYQLQIQPQEKIDHIARSNAELGNRVLDLAAVRAAEIARRLLD